MDIGWIERLGEVLYKSGIYADEIGPDGYRNRLKRILGCAEDEAERIESMAAVRDVKSETLEEIINMGYTAGEIINLLGKEDAAVTAEIVAKYKKDFKKMKVVTQGDSQVCYYGSMEKGRTRDKE